MSFKNLLIINTNKIFKNCAAGPMAHLFHGVHEQTYVAHVIAYAAKIGPFQVNSAAKTTPTLLAIICIVLALIKSF